LEFFYTVQVKKKVIILAITIILTKRLPLLKPKI